MADVLGRENWVSSVTGIRLAGRKKDKVERAEGELAAVLRSLGETVAGRMRG